MKNETVHSMTQGQLKDVAATLIGSIPELSFDEANVIIGNKRQLVADIQKVMHQLKIGPIISVSVSPKTPYQYNDRELISDVEIPAGEFELELVDIFYDTELKISGQQLVGRALKEDASLNQRFAEAVLLNKEKIPRSWRQHILAFPGTVRRDPSGGGCICLLVWNVSSWHLHFSWLGKDFNSNVRLLRHRQ